ncbi:MAG: acyl-CoA dehydrogenase family protein [Pseudomonadales bacterium]
MSQTDLLAAATQLSQVCYAAADEIEQQRRLPAELSAQLAAAGFYRMGIPEAVGGLETPPPISSEVIEILARGDASSAWVTFIGMTSGTNLAMIPSASARAIFTQPEVMLTGVFAPSGRADKVDGGFRVSGQWQWGSGSQNADWVMGGCMFFDDGEPLLDARGNQRTHMVIMPASDIEFLDTWHVSGLSGSGSLDFRVDDVFVPEDRVAGFKLEREVLARPLYSFPQFTFLALGIGAVCLGIARAAIDELIAVAVAKKRVGSSATIASRSTAQAKLAEAEADLRSARSFYYHELNQAWEIAQSGEKVSLEGRRDMRLATTNAVLKSAAVIDEMYNLGGGTSVYRQSRLQRYFRDVHVATQHIMVAPQTLETLGAMYFGNEVKTAMI